MSAEVKLIVSPTLLSTTEAVLYDVNVNTVTVIKYISLHNTGTSPVEVTISTPASGQISSSANQLSVKRIAGKETLRVLDAVDFPLSAGMSIRAVADVADLVNIRVGGLEIV